LDYIAALKTTKKTEENNMAGNKKLEIIVQEFITPKKHFMSNTRFVILILLLPISGYCIIREVKQKNFFLRSAAVRRG
jgi:hypothetical protein